MIAEMDEKDFSLEGLNDPVSDREETKRGFDELEDISFGSDNVSSKDAELPDSIDVSGDDISGDVFEEEPSADDGEEPAEEEQENDAETVEDFFAGFGDDDEEPEEETEEEDGEEYEEDYEDGAEEYYDDASGESEDAEPADETFEGEPEEDADGDVSDEFRDDGDIALSASSTNGVTDFRERRDPSAARKRSGNRKKKKKKRKSRVNNSIFGALILVTIILTVSLVVAITGIKIGMEYLGIGKSEDDITFNIPENATSDDICEILINNNLIENRTLFKIAMKLQHSPTLYPGDITLHPSMGYSAIIEELSKQRDIRKTVSITFQEGITLLEAADLLEKNKVCTAQEFLFEFNKKQGFSFENQIDDSADTFYKMEGFFFPDTYEFYVEDSGYNVTRTIKSNFASKVNETTLKTMQEKGLTLSELMTLASMVQWEANSAADMPKVASVFLNRLADPDKFPKLQSDATGNYLKKVVNVVGDTASKEHYADLYDTYVCTGLPEGPVCNPGIDAINAVLNPEKTKYYYFCNNLKTGKSYFAETLEEHNKNLVKAGLA